MTAVCGSSLNPSPFDGDIAAYPLEKVSWFVLNEIEGEALTGEGEPTAILRAAAKRFPGAKILLTLGKRGAMAAEGAAVYTHPIFPTPVRDTTAARGYLFGLLLCAAGGAGASGGPALGLRRLRSGRFG